MTTPAEGRPAADRSDSPSTPSGRLDGLETFLGFRYEAAGVVRLTITPQLINRAGLLSGAATYAMVDYAMGSALWAQRNEDEGIATLSIAVNYLRTALTGDIVCRAEVDRRNRTAATLRAVVENDERRLLVTAIGSYSIFRLKR